MSIAHDTTNEGVLRVEKLLDSRLVLIANENSNPVLTQPIFPLGLTAYTIYENEGRTTCGIRSSNSERTYVSLFRTKRLWMSSH